MRRCVLCLILMLCPFPLLADEHNVDFDSHTDFAALKTFALREAKVYSPRPELNNPLLARKVGDAIRAALLAKGLQETKTPDILVDYSITGEDFSAQRGGPAEFSQGTLVIDLVKRDSNMLVWRSVYRDNEKNNAKLAQKLPEDVKKSLSGYPPRQKGVIPPAAATPVVRQEKDPRAIAISVLEIVQSVREDSAFLGPAAHPGLDANLNGLERAARAVLEDNGRNSANWTNNVNRLLKATQETAEYANSIADRRAETADSKAKSRNLAQKLKSLLQP